MSGKNEKLKITDPLIAQKYCSCFQSKDQMIPHFKSFVHEK